MEQRRGKSMDVKNPQGAGGGDIHQAKWSLFVVLAVLLVGGVYFVLRSAGPQEFPLHQVEVETTTADEDVGLGTAIYEQAQNPVEGELDATNPFEQSYQNPFE